MRTLPIPPVRPRGDVMRTADRHRQCAKPQWRPQPPRQSGRRDVRAHAVRASPFEASHLVRNSVDEPAEVRRGAKAASRIECQRSFEIADGRFSEAGGRQERASRVVRRRGSARRTRRARHRPCRVRKSPVAPDSGPRVVGGCVRGSSRVAARQVIERRVDDPKAPVFVGDIPVMPARGGPAAAAAAPPPAPGPGLDGRAERL